MGPHYLDRLFKPNAIAVFGASERPGSLGERVFRNLVEGGFEGDLYPINPKRETVQERTAYPDLDGIHETVEMAVVATPAATVPAIIRHCGENGVRVAVVLSAGFGEGDGRGRDLQEDLEEEARRYGVRIVGPNCLGVMRPCLGLNATFSMNIGLEGDLALVSQSGALCTAILDWAEARGVGFSAMVSVGDAVDVGFGDLLDFLALDPKTRSILLYVEGVQDARRFLSGLRAAARMKPVIVVKAGRHEAGSRAAVSHTGALVGGDDVFDAALRRAGAVRAETIDELFSAAQILSSGYRARGTRLGILTNGGGPGVMATDRASELGLELPPPAEKTAAALDEQLPGHWSHGNPVDILGDASGERYAAAVESYLADPDIDGLLVMLTPQAMTEPLASAEAVTAAAEANRRKPVLACWMGEAHVQTAWNHFAERQIPYFPTPEASVQGFAYLAHYHRNQELLLQVPEPASREDAPDAEGARLIIEGALAEGRRTLGITESKAILRAFGIPVQATTLARSANEALITAEGVGFPVAMKIASADITHKSDVGGVRLNIDSAAAVRSAYNEMTTEAGRRAPQARIDGVTIEPMFARRNGRELMVGVIRDPVFGPVISFGAGGTAVEIHRDRAVALPPLNGYIIRDLIERTRARRMLDEFRDRPPVDRAALEHALGRISELVCELPWVREMDINPLIADEDGVIAVDARIVVEHPAPALTPYGHMAIHPYPGELAEQWQLPDGTNVTIRPIRPEDAEMEQVFVHNLSEQSRYFRFMETLQELSPEMLVRFTQIDYDREMAFVAVTDDGQGGELELGVTRYALGPDGDTGEFAVVVADEWRRRGLGARLVTILMQTARVRGLRALEGEVLSANSGMLGLARNLGFTVRNTDDPEVKRVSRLLGGTH